MPEQTIRFNGRPDGASAGRAVPHIVGIGGTTRIGSSSEAALRFTLKCAEAEGASVELIAGPLLDLPNYDPSDEHRSPSALRLVKSLRKADGVIISTPSYHGGISGMIKNALDYVEDMRDDQEPYFEGRSVGLIVSAYGAQALGITMASTRSIIHALRGWPTPYAATLNSAEKPFANGLPANESVAEQLRIVAQQTVAFANMKLAGGSGARQADTLSAANG
ncbi:NAD(P)H-dependent oxidoreductase [Hoeflea sp. WL0058]|uniref:NAD(P)H-dependent oxidoreductase n=1 Tax=Flavimaribacter sediminis TaxID=2865987 RepID=A0AAE2ZHG4_9HYPH|nr:NAD(P)H-dependent oxidoreductase [Flavimaribacter sediminis]MBW8636739.1 NAD(P)H-dependent oxidoreductase [Flavimaribacter sediminis]